ncbi:MAG: hypothetical protein ACFCUV_19000 [Rivularia sp. (in: cyanobacteria)]
MIHNQQPRRCRNHLQGCVKKTADVRNLEAYRQAVEQKIDKYAKLNILLKIAA